MSIRIQRWRRTRRECRLMTDRTTTDARHGARLLRDAAGALHASRRGGYVAVYRDGVRDYQPCVLNDRLV